MKNFLTFLIILMIDSVGFGQGNLFYWTGFGDGITWIQAANWTLPAPLPYGEPGGTSTWPGEAAEGDFVVFNNGNINSVTNVPTCTLGRLEVNRFESLTETFVYLSGVVDGSTISMRSPSQYIINEGTQWIVKIGEMCTLDMNQGMATNRVKLVCQPGAHVWQQNSSFFFPAEYPECDSQMGFVVKADEYGHAEFIPQSYVDQDVKGWTEYYIPDEQYHYISPPVTSTWPASGEFANQFCRKHNSLGVFNGDFVRKYDNIACSPWGWCEWIGNVNWYDPVLNIETGRGYEYYGSTGSDPLHAFYGVFNSGPSNDPVSLPILSQDWNFVGNPFPSAIILQTPCCPGGPLGWTWNKNYTDPVIYFWNNTMGGYQFFNWFTGIGNGQIPAERNVIPRSQGFFVHVSVYSPPSSDLQINNECRYFRGNIQIGKSGVANCLEIRLKDSDGNEIDQALIGFMENAGEGQFDPLRDAYKLFNDTLRVSQLYFRTSDDLFAAMKILKPAGNVVYPLCLKVARTGCYKLDVKDTDSFSANAGILLKDNLTNRVVDLKLNNMYTFVAEAGSDDSRFSLYFSNLQNGIPDQDESDFQVYNCYHSIVIRNNVPESISGTVTVYDLLERKIMMEELNINGTTKFGTDLMDGIYIVSIKTEKGIYNYKVLLD